MLSGINRAVLRPICLETHQEEVGAMLSHLAFYAGWPKVFSAMPVAKEVFESRAETSE